jgi:hypothetical protein
VTIDELLATILRGEAVAWPLDADAAFEAALLDAAHVHGVAALLSPGAVHRWPDTVQIALRNIRRQEAVREAVRREHLLGLLAAFRQADVHCLLLKGAHLAYTVYERPWLRPRFDTDLLVGPGQQARADGVLRALGYAPSPQVSGTLVAHQRQYQRRDRFAMADILDLHWKITNPHLFADAVTFDELMAAAQPIALLGDHALGPSNVHALILACVHRVAHHHNSDLLIWLYDIHLLAGAMAAAERDAFAELATVKGLRSVCASGIDHASRRFGTSYPAGWRDRLEIRNAGEVEPSAAFLQQELRQVDILLSDLRAVSGWAPKLRLLREHLFPPPAYVRAKYGPHTPLFVAYVDRILFGVGKWFRAQS